MALDINIIISESDEMQDANNVVDSTDVPATDKDKNNAKKKKDRAELETMFVANYALGVAKSTIKQTANYFINDIGRSNGDSNLQTVINKRISQAGEVLGIAGGAIAGAKLGSAYGPIGTFVGTALGAGAGAISKVFNDAEKERAYEHARFQENTSQAYNLSRANYSALTGRVR